MTYSDLALININCQWPLGLPVGFREVVFVLTPHACMCVGVFYRFTNLTCCDNKDHD